MQNAIANGKTAVVLAPAAVSAGDFVVVGKTFGVAQNDAASGAEVVLAIGGVFELPKATGAAWTAGDQLYWDAGAGKFTKTSGESLSLGVAHDDAASGDAVGNVRLYPVALVGPSAQQAAIVSLTDNSGGAAGNDTLVAVNVPADISGGESPTEAEHNAALAAMRKLLDNSSDLAAKVNDIIAKLRLAGVIEDA